VTAQARVEFTNIFNRIRPNDPTSTNAQAPQVQATSPSGVATGFGAISWVTVQPTTSRLDPSTGGARQGQMVFRLTF